MTHGDKPNPPHDHGARAYMAMRAYYSAKKHGGSEAQAEAAADTAYKKDPDPNIRYGANRKMPMDPATKEAYLRSIGREDKIPRIIRS